MAFFFCCCFLFLFMFMFYRVVIKETIKNVNNNNKRRPNGDGQDGNNPNGHGDGHGATTVTNLTLEEELNSIYVPSTYDTYSTTGETEEKGNDKNEIDERLINDKNRYKIMICDLKRERDGLVNEKDTEINKFKNNN